MTDRLASALSKQIIVIVGAYGSGKSEVAVNLALHLASVGIKQIQIADLDVVNPYFRSREAVDELTNLGITSLIPEGEQSSADLPIIIPGIKAALEQPSGVVILDVGGDNVGAKVLRSMADAFSEGSYDLLITLNKNRPFTSDLDASLKMMNSIETASGLKFTGLISNTHLIDDTTSEVVLDGLALSRQVSDATGLPIKFVAAINAVFEKMNINKLDCPTLSINRSLTKPWERKTSPGSR